MLNDKKKRTRNSPAEIDRSELKRAGDETGGH